MLKGIPPLIGPELLGSLARMGHGDVLLVVDENYPAYAAGVPVHRLDGVGVERALEAVLTLLPLDTFIDAPVFRMHPVGESNVVTPLQDRVHRLIERIEGRDIEVAPVERTDFYARAQRSFAVLATGEHEPYGCFGMTKGVLEGHD
jgi:L-fucose mutarotase